MVLDGSTLYIGGTFSENKHIGPPLCVRESGRYDHQPANVMESERQRHCEPDEGPGCQYRVYRPPA